MKRFLKFIKRCDDPECWLNAVVPALCVGLLGMIHAGLWIWALALERGLP